MNRFIVILFVFVCASCAPTRYVVPLNKREKSVSASYGGPIFKEDGIPMPLPLVNITYAKGKTNSLTYFGGLQLSPLLNGYFAGEIGALKEWKWWSKRKLGITTNFVANAVYEAYSGFHFFPQFDANLYWHFKSDPHYFCDCPGDPKWKMFVYTGFQTHYNLVSNYIFTDPFKDDVMFSPHAGYSFGTDSWRLSTEVKWIQPWVDNTSHKPEIWNPMMPTGTFGGFITFYNNF